MNNRIVSIIVPVYNAENFIEKCVTTLFEQDYDSIEYIFVNDCTPDNSINVLKEIIKKYPNRKNSIKIINNIKNQGSSLSRKIGLDIANGEYILFVDSDDWVELDMVSSLVKEAIKTDADIVACDFFINYSKKEIYKKENYEKITQESMLKALLSDNIMPCVWNKIYKKSLFDCIIFPKFQTGEDFYLNTQLFYYAKNISYLNKAFLHYNRTNSSSISKSFDKENIIDLKDMCIAIETFLKSKHIFEAFKKYYYIRMCYIILSKSNCNSKDLFLKICNNANNIEYVWANSQLSYFKKIIFSLPFFKLDTIFYACKTIYKKVKIYTIES